MDTTNRTSMLGVDGSVGFDAANPPPGTLSDYKIVLALDIGTSYSGYAFSTKAEQNEIVLNKTWGNGLGILTNKTPSAVLTDDRMSCIEFGYEAQRIYSEDKRKCHLFEANYKMKLYKPEFSKPLDKIVIVSRRGDTSINLLALIKMSIKYLYSHAMEELKNAYDGIDESLVRVVLTIPAIWTDSAKDFMKRAANKTGIDTDRLLLALEPEAASLYCRTLKPKALHPNSLTDVTLVPGTKYIVVDCGGGTVDITAHEVVDDVSVKEIHCANGGPWGGGNVFKEFELILCDLLGKKFIEEYKQAKPEGWFTIEQSFELIKRKHAKNTQAHIALPVSMIRAFKGNGLFKKDIYKHINRRKDEFIFTKDGILILSEKVSEKIFSTTIEKILDHIHLLWDNNEIADAKYAFMVGGFSNSDILYYNVKEAVTKLNSRVHVIRPLMAEIAVLKGAVIFGHLPHSISSRISRWTYGAGVMRNFDPQKHDTKKKIIIGGEEKCKDIFNVWVKKNESIAHGQSKTYTMFPHSEYTTGFKVSIFATEREDVMYTSEDGVFKLATLNITIPDNHLPQYQRAVKNYLYFGETELYVRIQDTTRPDGASREAKIQYEEHA